MMMYRMATILVAAAYWTKSTKALRRKALSCSDRAVNKVESILFPTPESARENPYVAVHSFQKMRKHGADDQVGTWLVEMHHLDPI